MWASRRQYRRFLLILFAPAIMSFVWSGKAQTAKAATAKDVCAFVTKEMTSAVPQVPTLCVPKSGNIVNFELSVFSPTEVLEGKMRRTWSTALFIVFGELYFDDSLNGICKADYFSNSASSHWFGCVFLVSDSYLSQHGEKQYRLIYPAAPSAPGDPLHGDPASDEWYKRWWSLLISGQQWAVTGTPENARAIAINACAKYITALRHDSFAIQQPELMPIPGCSVLLATSSRADVIVHFADWSTPALSEYERFLIETFGKSFDGTPYAGAVIFRSDWASTQGETKRSNWSYNLNDLEFGWEEMNSGVRSDAVFETSDQREPGQTRLHTEEVGSGIVLKTVDAPGRGKILDLTNGSEWLISADAETEARCAIAPGLQVVHTTDGKMQIIGGGCGGFKATFAGGW